MIILGTLGNDILKSPLGNDVIVGFDGNDTVIGSGNDIVLEGNGNDQIVFNGSGGDIVYAGNGNDNVILSWYSIDNRVILGFGNGDMVTGSIGNDYIVAPGNYATIDGYGGGDTIVLGGRHDVVVERFNGFDGPGDHLTQVQDGIVDRIFAFNRTDHIQIEGYGRHPSWHQGPHGMLVVHGEVVARVDHHLTVHDLIFI